MLSIIAIALYLCLTSICYMVIKICYSVTEEITFRSEDHILAIAISLITPWGIFEAIRALNILTKTMEDIDDLWDSIPFYKYPNKKDIKYFDKLEEEWDEQEDYLMEKYDKENNYKNN